MADLKRQPDQTWERFFEILFPCESDCEEPLPRKDVQADLRRLGIDVGEAVRRVQQAAALAKGKAEIADARARRLGVTDQLNRVVVPAEQNLRTRLHDVIAGRLAGTEQSLYFRKLESAATDDDLQSLLDDIHRLDQLSEGPAGGDPDPSAR